MCGFGPGTRRIFFLKMYPLDNGSLTHDLLCVLSMDTWWNFGHELKKNGSGPGSKLRVPLVAPPPPLPSWALAGEDLAVFRVACVG